MSKLFLVPTPIGNLLDISFRAIEVLKEVDLILVEDTRVSGKLLKKYDICTPMRSHHQHNEHQRVDELVKKMDEGMNMALISDAGTPCISDPGFLLVRACVNSGISVECLPGATAFVPALAVSGLPSDRFVFEGFLPTKKGRKKRLEQLAKESRTMIFYESPHRIEKTLKDFREYFGKNRPISISRELSKLHEETIRGSVEEVLLQLNGRKVKGEVVLVVGG